MKISILTLFPELYKPFIATSLLQRAQEKGVISFSVCSMFDFTEPKVRIDGPTFGHGPGMVIKPDVVERALAQEDPHNKALKIFFSPQGKKLDQRYVKELAAKMLERQAVVFLPARYEGMDARIEEEYADEIISVGDCVLMGGDIPTMMTLEAVLRYVPSVVGRQASVEHDSFSGAFVDHPEYTAPVVWKGREVPEVVRSGNHAALQAWRESVAVKRTVIHHFDWLRSYPTSIEEDTKISQALPTHYVALLHDDIMLPGDRVGTTSVTSLDIHDIARSAKTYGVAGYFIVTPLNDQQRIVKTLLQFWQEGIGITYNPHRHEALAQVHLVSSLSETVEQITQREGKKPVIIITSAQAASTIPLITYHDQERVWGLDRPILIILGTGRGIAPIVEKQADFKLVPVEGYSRFNHLSVRSAAAIIFDRWLGKQPRYYEK